MSLHQKNPFLMASNMKSLVLSWSFQIFCFRNHCLKLHVGEHVEMQGKWSTWRSPPSHIPCPILLFNLIVPEFLTLSPGGWCQIRIKLTSWTPCWCSSIAYWWRWKTLRVRIEYRNPNCYMLGKGRWHRRTIPDKIWSSDYLWTIRVSQPAPQKPKHSFHEREKLKWIDYNLKLLKFKFDFKLLLNTFHINYGHRSTDLLSHANLQ